MTAIGAAFIGTSLVLLIVAWTSWEWGVTGPTARFWVPVSRVLTAIAAAMALGGVALVVATS